MKVSPTPGHNAVQAAQSREQVQENKKVLPVPSTAPATELHWFHNVMAVCVQEREMHDVFSSFNKLAHKHTVNHCHLYVLMLQQILIFITTASDSASSICAFSTAITFKDE